MSKLTILVLNINIKKKIVRKINFFFNLILIVNVYKINHGIRERGIFIENHPIYFIPFSS